MAFGIGNLKSIFERPKPSSVPAGSNQATDASALMQQMDSIYNVEAQNWYTAKPYGFKATTRDGRSFVLFLPINPSNLSISTNFATNIMPTLYGTIEEHSDVRYFDITIEGTTGMAPKYVEPASASDIGTAAASLRRPGRSSFSIAEGISLGGFFSKTLSAVNKIKNKAADLLDGGPKPKSGLAAKDSGYVAFHNLYRFLLQYKKDAAGVDGNTEERKAHPLTFFNYKDNNQYDVAVRSFVLRKSAENPMLYFYSIQLRGYNLRPIADKVDEDMQQRLRDLGLNGVDSSSILGDIKSLSKTAKSIVGASIGGINLLGR